MYRFCILSVGKLKRAPLAALCADYATRLRRGGGFEEVELKDGTEASETERLLSALDKRRQARVFVLAEEGVSMRSRAFAETIWDPSGRPAVFVIGGAYGLGDAVKRRADKLLSLTPLTLPHEMARLILYEQLYRAVSIKTGRSYHND